MTAALTREHMESFCEIWNSSPDVKSVAERLGISRQVAIDKAVLLRKRGYDAEYKNRRCEEEIQLFIDAWNKYHHTRDVAEAMGMTLSAANSKASKLRKLGYRISKKSRYHKTFEERFWEKVKKTSGCWGWTGHRSGSGYGRLRGPVDTGSVQIYAHRASYEINIGPIPDEMLVCHHCDNPQCVRPEHLFLGTQKENHQDMLSKKRGRGQANQPFHFDKKSGGGKCK